MLRITMFALVFIRFAYGGDIWDQWRGPTQNGVAPDGEYPVQWSSVENVAWRVSIRGKGGSTPIVAGGLIYVTHGNEKQNVLSCFDMAGKRQWDAEIGDDFGGKHKKGSGSNPSPVTDGRDVYCYYRSGDIARVDPSGNVLWHVNLQEQYGEDTLWWDLGTSPVLTRDAVVVAVMQSGPSYLVALDKRSGKQIWKTDRMLDAPEEAAQSYSTPQVVTINGKQIVAVLGADHVTLHDVLAGGELGRLGGFNPDNERYWRSIASPVVEGDLIFCPYARGNTITAVSLSKLVRGKGTEAIVWQRHGLGADVPTPVASNGRLFVVHDKGRVECVESETGKTLWEGEMPKHRLRYSSSPVLADGKLYLTREDATTFVLSTGDSFEIVATNTIDSDQPYTVASLAAVDNGFLLRSSRELIRIRGTPQ